MSGMGGLWSYIDEIMASFIAEFRLNIYISCACDALP
jgi:hypothetical protein